MRFFRIAPKVANVTARRKTLEDKEALYPESMWPVGQADELVSRGFLVESEGSDKKINNPADAVIEDFSEPKKETETPAEPKKEYPRNNKKGKR